MSDVQINNYSAAVLESLFKAKKNANKDEIFDSSVYLYNAVKKEGIYPPKIVAGFYSAMAILSELTLDQFWQIKSLYSV